MTRWAVQTTYISAFAAFANLRGSRPFPSTFAYYRWRWVARLVAWMDDHTPLPTGMVVQTRLLGRVTRKDPMP